VSTETAAERGLDGPAGAPLLTLRSRRGVALVAATVLASGVGSYDAYVVNVAVPAIGRELHGSVAAVQWTLTSYLLTVGGLLLLAGALADRYGRRRILSIGLLVMLVGSVLCALAPTIGALVAARVVQGVGAALVVPTSLALLNGSLRTGERARAIGIWAGLSTLATTVGPYAGGWLVDHRSWRSVFLLNIPLIVAALVVVRLVPERSARSSATLDVLGGLLAVVGLGGLVYALNDGAASGWLTARVLVPAAVGVVALALLVPVERRATAPMLRPSLFRSRQCSAINGATVLLYGALSAATYLLVLQCELMLGYTAAQAGAALIPSTLVFLALSPLSGALVSRFGTRWLMVIGMLLIGLSFVWLSAAQPGTSYRGAILPPALLRGLGLGLTVAPLTAAVLAAVPDEDLGEGTAVNDAAARIGAVVAIALVPALVGASSGRTWAAALERGFGPAMVVIGAVCGLAALVAGLFVSSRPTASHRFVPPAPDHGCAVPCRVEPAVTR
jgi:EmrB/QacA subfamily drug resistance transporter